MSAVSCQPTFSRRASGLYVPARLRRPVAIDLFCGCGGMSLGFIQAGFEVVAALDNNPAAATTYMYNLGAYPCQFHFADDDARDRLERHLAKSMQNQHGVAVMPVSGGARADGPFEGWPEGYPGVQHFFFGDARAFTGEQILEAVGLEPGAVDCVCGGPPCQGFTRANRYRGPDDPRNNLVFEFARLVLEIRPKTILMENVPEIASMMTPEGISVLDKFCLILEEGGFAAADALKRVLLAKPGARVCRRAQASKPKPEPRASNQPMLF